MRLISAQSPVGIMERTMCIIDYMASSIASKEDNAPIEQAGAFFILSDASDNVKTAMDEVIQLTDALNASISEAIKLRLIDDRFEKILHRNIDEKYISRIEQHINR